MRIAVALLLATFVLCPESAMAVETGFVERSYKDDAGAEHRYVVFVPKSYDGTKETPLVVFLHGAGERGTDNKKQVEVGLGPAVRRQADTFPAIVLFPQAEKTWVLDSDDQKRALAELAQVEAEFKVDRTREYVTGLSMGGRGTYDLIRAQPDRFAAAGIICGFFDLDAIEPVSKLPTWFFHGAADPVVSVKNSRDAVAKLKELGADVRYSEYPQVLHNSWIQAYDEPEFFTWLFSHQRPSK